MYYIHTRDLFMQFIFPTKGSKERFPKGQLLQAWGEHPGTYSALGMAFHNGVDIAPIKRLGESVVAPHDGVVSSIHYDPKGLGNQIDILSPAENGVAYLSTLAHLTEVKLVKLGQKVKRGRVVGKMGNSGFVVTGPVERWGGVNPDGTGTHLHWSLKILKPVRYGEPSNMSLFGQDYLILHGDNGVGGAIDPLVYV